MSTRLVWLLVIALCAASSIAAGPCGPIPGGELSGPEAAEPVSDWGFANQVPRCAVEVRPEEPRSVTVNCMSWEARLFVSCSGCEVKEWAGMALGDPTGRVDVAGTVYPVTLTRVTAPEELDAVWIARAQKLGEDPQQPRPDGWWTFELVSRVVPDQPAE